MEVEIRNLDDMPLRHSIERDEQLKLRNLRKLIVDNYLVFYMVNEKTETVFIIRVLYARRDWMNLILSKGKNHTLLSMGLGQGRLYQKD